MEQRIRVLSNLIRFYEKKGYLKIAESCRKEITELESKKP